MSEKEEIFKRMSEGIVNFDIQGVKKAAEEAVRNGIPAYEAIMKGMSRGMEVVGKKFEDGEYFLSDLLMAGEAMKAGMKVFKPYLKLTPAESAGRVVIGTVEGDIHDIGKNIVSTLLVSAGFEVFDLGVDVKAVKFIEKVQEVEADILAMSALLTVTMKQMEKVIEELKKAGMREKVKVIVGGAPIDEDFAKKIGADTYGQDAVVGVEACKRLLGR